MSVNGFFHIFVNMKRIGICLLIVVAGVSGYAGIDLPGRHALKMASAGKSISRTVDTYVPAVIKISSEEALQELVDMGSVVFNRRDELVLVCIPSEQLQNASELMSVKRVSVGTGMRPYMDKARVMGRADMVASGVDLPQSYNGEGIVVGFSDIGFDPHHVNFRNGDGSGTRVKRIVSYVDTLASRRDMSTENAITSWVTDHYDEWHATHVAGTLAGNYSVNGYQGIATAADIVATTSDLSDACILAGVEDVIEYAKEQGRPAVVNLSLGSHIGSHDGTDLFCQYLDRLGEEAIICISASNEGYQQDVVAKDFESADDRLKTFVFDRGWNGLHISGISDFWSSDSRDFQAAVCIYDCVDYEMLYVSDFVGGYDGLQEWGIASSDCAASGDETNDVFDRCFSGYLRLYSELNEENSRYNIMFTYDVVNKDYKGVWGRYCPGIILKAEPGVHINGYADGYNSFFRSMGVSGFVDGTSDGSISNIACGHNVVVVGASNSRNTTPLVSGGEVTYNFEVGTVADFTSYGTLLDGRKLPHFCAPGNMVVSSVSSPYIEAHGELDIDNTMAAKATVDGKDYYWITECGTSMSTPYTAGVFALWLQADPTLTVKDVRDIAIATAIKDAPDITDPKWGAGELDAYEGMKMVLSEAGTGYIPAGDAQRLLIARDGYRRFRVTVAGASSVRATLYSVTGIPQVKSGADGDNTIVDASQLASGVYVLEVESDVSRHAERIVVR